MVFKKDFKNIKLLIEYDGTPYAGWQLQERQDTVQGRLMAALLQVTGAPVRLNVAGRTDAGVHAVGQVANFVTLSRLAAVQFAPALNANLPETIRIHRAEQVPLAFDARRDSSAKRYRYRIYEGATRAPLDLHRAWHIRCPLDIAAMQQAASHLIGELDFEAFRSAQCDAEHAQRNMYEISITAAARPPVGRYVDITFHANAFCRHMCRILAGTLVEVGRGRRSAASIRELLLRRDRTAAGVTAPAFGLTLLEVIYP